MSEKNYKSVSTWKLVLILMVVLWLVNGVMAFVYSAHVDWIWTNILVSLIETGVLALLCYSFYLLFFRGKEEKKEKKSKQDDRKSSKDDDESDED